MTSEEELREKLRKIETLFAKGATEGERAAAGAAAERIRERLRAEGKREKAIEVKLSIYNEWSRQLFAALSRRYGLKPYRYPRTHRQTVFVKAPITFVENVLWPEFENLDAALQEYLSEITERIIREEVHKDTTDAEEVSEAPRLS